MNAPSPPPIIDMEKRVGQYVALRDKIKAIKERHSQELAPYNEALDKLGNLLLGALNTTHQDSAKTGAGTVYKTEKKSATIADQAAFRRHVIGSQAWDLIDMKANAPAVAAFIEEHQTPPPGVNYTVHIEVGVRRK
jgi:hypothetical protein